MAVSLVLFLKSLASPGSTPQKDARKKETTVSRWMRLRCECLESNTLSPQPTLDSPGRGKTKSKTGSEQSQVEGKRAALERGGGDYRNLLKSAAAAPQEAHTNIGANKPTKPGSKSTGHHSGRSSGNNKTKAQSSSRAAVDDDMDLVRFGTVTEIGTGSDLNNNDDSVQRQMDRRTANCVCVDCSLCLDSDLSLYQHCRTQHSDSLVHAQCCGKTFYTRTAFVVHAEQQHRGQHVCMSCHEFFATRSVLARHLEAHGAREGRSVLFCMLCGACRRSEEQMVDHIRQLHATCLTRQLRERHLQTVASHSDSAALSPPTPMLLETSFICRVPLRDQPTAANKPRHTTNEFTNSRNSYSSGDSCSDGGDVADDFENFSSSSSGRVLPCVAVENLSDCILGSFWTSD